MITRFKSSHRFALSWFWGLRKVQLKEIPQLLGDVRIRLRKNFEGWSYDKDFSETGSVGGVVLTSSDPAGERRRQSVVCQGRHQWSAELQRHGTAKAQQDPRL